MTSRKILKYSYPANSHSNIIATNDKFLCYRSSPKSTSLSSLLLPQSTTTKSCEKKLTPETLVNKQPKNTTMMTMVIDGD